jgi:hypothetical protein
MCARDLTLAPSLPGADVKCDGREGKTRECAEEARTVRDVYVRVDCSSAEHGSVAIVGRSAGGRQGRSGAERHDRHGRDRSELFDLHVARARVGDASKE